MPSDIPAVIAHTLESLQRHVILKRVLRVPALVIFRVDKFDESATIKGRTFGAYGLVEVEVDGLGAACVAADHCRDQIIDVDGQAAATCVVFVWRARGSITQRVRSLLPLSAHARLGCRVELAR